MKKVFLTVLGTGNYKDCYYFSETQEYRSKFVQEALLKLIKEEKQINDIEVKILLTDAAKQKNYIATNTDDQNLEDVLNKLNIKAQLIQIPEGKTEEELWQIFEKTIESIDDDTEIILDITHSLRNIPIQILVALNYLKLFKNISLSNIYYGAFELGEFIDDPLHKGEKIKRAPICNLNVYYDLLNWTEAINSFCQTGNSTQIVKVFKESKSILHLIQKQNPENKNNLYKVVNSLENFTQCINTCRGMYPPINKANSKSISFTANNLYNNINTLSDNISIIPLKHLFSIIKEKVEPFANKTAFEVGMATVKWCIDYNLYQQGYTALDESIKTFICDKLNIDSKIKRNREDIANTILTCLKYKPKEWKIDTKNENDDQLVRNIATILKQDKDFCALVNSIRERRNDINHFGYTESGCGTYSVFIKDLENFYNNFSETKDDLFISL